MIELNHNVISEQTDLTSIWSLPQFPLTELFGDYSPEGTFFDQELMFSETTGHVQLRYQLSPSVLYSEDSYAYRTASSGTGMKHLEAFCRFFHSFSDRDFSCAVDVGGNDGSLFRNKAIKATRKAVIDPVCGNTNNTEKDGIRWFNCLLHEVDLAEELGRPDLVFCRHTLEHVPDPRSFIDQLFSQTSDDALFVFEVPDFSLLINKLRFDAVFHQHLQYFTADSFSRLIHELGGEMLCHEQNPNGPVGGSVFLAFRKAKKKESFKTDLDIELYFKTIGQAIERFKRQTSLLNDILNAQCSDQLYGMGASLLLPSLVYHLPALNDLQTIYDDDESKCGLSYRNLRVTVSSPTRRLPEKNQSWVITSMEAIRPLVRRVQDFSPNKIIAPLIY